MMDTEKITKINTTFCSALESSKEGKFINSILDKLKYLNKTDDKKRIINRSTFINGLVDYAIKDILSYTGILDLELINSRLPEIINKLDFAERKQFMNISKKSKRTELINESLTIHKREDLDDSQKLERVMEITKELDKLDKQKAFADATK